MKTRILTAIALILVVLPPVFYGGWLLQVLGVVVVVAGCYEWLHALDGFQRWGIWLTPLMVLWILGQYFIPGQYLFPYWVAAVMLFWSLPVFFPSVSHESGTEILAVMFVMGLAYLSMQKLIPVHQYLWTLCFATYGSDTGAYFSGRFLGKHKMIERVSPKKTWEGFFGGWLFGFVLSYAVSMLYLPSVNPTVNFLICLLAPAFAELGDLCFSSLKRAHSLKDFSNLLPGHGGILDRVDSLMMNFLLFGLLISLF